MACDGLILAGAMPCQSARSWLTASLLVASVGSAGAVAPFACNTYNLPLQVLKNDGTSYYKLVQLNLASNTFDLIYDFDTPGQVNNRMNAMAFNPVDGIA